MKETLFEKFKRVFHVQNNMKALKHDLVQHDLIQQTLHSEAMGVSPELLCEHEVMVSLTTYGRRLNDVAPTIESIMQGSVLPNRIVLWLGDELRDEELPVALRRQQRRGLEVEYCKDIRSYTKLVPALRANPDAIIITVDDDAIYPYDLVERLVREHRRYPKHIISARVHRVRLNRSGRPLGYTSWEQSTNTTDDSPLNFLTGVGGVLYPPHSLHPEVFNEEVFLDICRFADDVWFYAMALMQGTRIRKCPTHMLSGDDYLSNDTIQDTGLLLINTRRRGHCANDDQLQAVFDRYNLWGKLGK